MAAVLGFPNPVNEVAARTVAGGVVLISVATVVLTLAAGTGWLWLTVVLAYGFVARLLTGPRLSPLGQLATRVVAPRLGSEKLVAGPPKRFAQGIGAALTVAAAVLHFGFAADTAAVVLLCLLIGAAVLESVFGLCLGCRVFALLMRAGLVPEKTCEACANVGLRLSSVG
jgi:uncharacterized protein DUF4395